MRHLKKTVLSFVVLAVGLISVSELSAVPQKKFHTQEKMKSHLEIIKHILDAGYAPVEWKESYFGWSLDAEINKAKNRVDAKDLTIKEFQKIVRDFFMSMHDHHVSVKFHSTESASLPFLIKGAFDKYYITHIDNQKLSHAVYRMDIGDELVSFGGKSTHEAVLELQQEHMMTTSEGTDRSITEIFLTNRIGSYAHEIPTGPVMIGIKKAGQIKVQNYQLTWDHEPELITDQYKHSMFQKNSESIFGRNIFRPLMVSSYDDFFMKLCSTKKKCGHRPGSRKSFLPLLGKKWWNGNGKNSFHTYLYENEAGNLIGYVRIPHYMGSTKEVLEFADIIKYLDERSDALVIDQVNNPGGSLFYMCALAGLLTDQPLHVPKHQVAINQEYVAEALQLIPLFEGITDDEAAIASLGESFYGHPVTYQMTRFFLNYFRFIINEWNGGRTLTRPTYLYGFDKINPSPYGCYTKPILILVNELSISCGDFFPAVFQDNKRATIMGSKTSGAGGFVLSAFFPNLFGLNYFRYTGSIAERLDKNPIENLGVTPDVPYQISEVDLQNSYSEYKQAINETVLEILYKERG